MENKSKIIKKSMRMIRQAFNWYMSSRRLHKLMTSESQSFPKTVSDLCVYIFFGLIVFHDQCVAYDLQTGIASTRPDLFDGFGLAEERTSAGEFFVDIGMLPPLETSRMRFILPDLLIVSVGGCTFFVRRMRKRKQKREKENEAARREKLLAEGGVSRRGMQAIRNSSRAMASMAGGACLFPAFHTPNMLHDF